jgi:butyrate kinase
MYKMLMRMTATDRARMACVTVGIKTPYIITSRSDPERSKIDSIALSCIYSNHLRNTAGRKDAPKQEEVLKRYHLLTVNPGSTSTKLALFENRQCLKNFEVARPHKSGLTGEALDSEVEEYVARIKEFLTDDLPRPDAVVGRGGFLNRENQRIKGGVYQVCSVEDGEVQVEDDIISAVRDFAEMDHASNLGIPIAARLAREFRIPAFSVDPVVSDDLQEEARYSGYAPIERKSIGHILSIRASARKAAAMIGRPFEKSGFLVAHIGGGTSVAAVRNGEIIDKRGRAARRGTVHPAARRNPAAERADRPLLRRTLRQGVAEGRTHQARGPRLLPRRRPDAEDRATHQGRRRKGGEGDERHGLSDRQGDRRDEHRHRRPRRCDRPDRRLARSEFVVGMLKKRIGHLAQMIIFRDNMEMEAMATGALSILRGEAEPRRYQLKRG